MGTRNLTSVIYKKKTVIAQYGQWDGYPRGRGKTILEFLRNADLDRFKQQLSKVRFANESDEKKERDFLDKIGADNGWMTSDQAKLWRKEYPYNSRDHGAFILNLIYDSEDDEIVLSDSSDFVKDSLFCEWAYVIDLDKEEFRVVAGAEAVYSFANLPTDEEFFKIVQEEHTQKGAEEPL